MDDYRVKGVPPPSIDPTCEPDEPPLASIPTTQLLDTTRPTWILVLALAWPKLLQQLLIFSVNIFDGLLAGRYQHVEAAAQIASQSAQTTANYLAWFLTNCTILVSVGATALVARFLGAGDRSTAVKAANQSVLLGLILGIGGGIAGYFCLPSILWALQLHDEEAKLGLAFLRPLFALLVFQVVESVGIACLEGAGDTRTGMIVLGGVAVVNMPLTWLFFNGLGPIPAYGFPGIGLGTAVAHLLGGLAVLGVLIHGRAGIRLSPKLLWPDMGLIRRLLWISVPAGLDSISLALGHLWFLGIVNEALGETARAAHGIAIRWEGLSYMSGAAFGTAAMALVGQNLGAGRPAQAARSGWTAFALGSAWMMFMGAVFYVLAPEMFGLFCPKPEQASIVVVGVPVLRLVALAQPGLAATNICTSALRGAGDTRIPVFFSWFGFFAVRIPLAYLLTRSQINLGPLGVWPGLGLLGAWMAMFLDLYVRGLFILARFASGRWKRLRV